MARKQVAGQAFENKFGAWVRAPTNTDAFDMGILELLQADARLSARGVAKRLGKSPGAVLERIARLESEGVIQGYFARIDPARLGSGMLAIVGAQAAHDSNLPVLVDRILEIQECENVFVVTGRWDLLIHLRVRDQHHLTDVLFNELWKSPGFRHSETMIAVHQAGAHRLAGDLESRKSQDGSGNHGHTRRKGDASRRAPKPRAAARRAEEAHRPRPHQPIGRT